MLAGDGTTHLDEQFQDGSAEGLGALDIVGLVGIEQDEEMQIAVAGVE